MKTSLCAFAAFALSLISSFAIAGDEQSAVTRTPIKHVIVVMAENRSFDHLFGVYEPTHGQTVLNLLSEKIVTKEGSPGSDYAKSDQFSAETFGYYASAPDVKDPYTRIPPVMTGEAPEAASDLSGPPFLSLKAVASREIGVVGHDQALLLEGATGQPAKSIDTRFKQKLKQGVYPITPDVPVNAYMAGPVHRFFQMWQQLDCRIDKATPENPSGCLADLFPWVEVTAGAGSNGKPRPELFDDQSTGEGSVSMGFYNMAKGDAPYFKELADTYTLSDNYHQAVNGGTGANHIMLGTGDMIWYAGNDGRPAKPPIDEIENPDPQPGTNNYYRQDGYAGGSYVECANDAAPGVRPISDYLASLPSKPTTNCEKNHYYLVNNYNPGFLASGAVESKDRYTVPPVPLRTIGDALTEKKISYRYYGEGWNAYKADPKNELYCNICNFLQYTPSVMKNASMRRDHLADLDKFYADLEANNLPAVSYVKPSGLNDGHPTSSRVDILEAFTRQLVDAVKGHPKVWADTAIFILFDEGGGYWDSGYIQPIDFFGDGTRVPFLVVSPYSQGGKIVHTYDDHASVLKFIEANWGLEPLSKRSRDNLPNPQSSANNLYVPTNSPAIGDLMDMFQF